MKPKTIPITNFCVCVTPLNIDKAFLFTQLPVTGNVLLF